MNGMVRVMRQSVGVGPQVLQRDNRALAPRLRDCRAGTWHKGIIVVRSETYPLQREIELLALRHPTSHIRHDTE